MQLRIRKNKRTVSGKEEWYISVYKDKVYDEVVMEIMKAEPTDKQMEEFRTNLFRYKYVFDKFAENKLYVKIEETVNDNK